MSDVFPGVEYVPSALEELRGAIMDVSLLGLILNTLDVLLTLRFAASVITLSQRSS